MTRVLSVALFIALAAASCQNATTPPPERARARATQPRSSQPVGLHQARQQYRRVHKALAAAAKKKGPQQTKQLLAGLGIQLPLECEGVLMSHLGLHQIPASSKAVGGAALYPGTLIVVRAMAEESASSPSSAASKEYTVLCTFNVVKKSPGDGFALIAASLDWESAPKKGATLKTRWSHFPKGRPLMTVEVRQKPSKGRTIGDDASGPFARIDASANLYRYVQGRFHRLHSHQIEEVQPIRGDGDDGYEKTSVTLKFLTVGSPKRHIAIRIHRRHEYKPPLPGTPSADIGDVDSWEEFYMFLIFSPNLDKLLSVSKEQRKALLKLGPVAPYRKSKSSAD